MIRGNHHDGWVFGAADPLSGTGRAAGRGQAIGALVEDGWRPKRTIVYASWDAEEPGLLGSTEWAETHADELQQEGRASTSTPTATAAASSALGGSHDLQQFVTGVADVINDPETRVSVGARRARRGARRRSCAGRATNMPRPMPRRPPIPRGICRSSALGSGSDYSAFLQHLGVATLDFGYGGEGERRRLSLALRHLSSITANSSIRASSMARCWPRRRARW